MRARSLVAALACLVFVGPAGDIRADQSKPFPVVTPEQIQWKEVEAPTYWRPRKGDELIGYYAGQTKRNGKFGEYTLCGLPIVMTEGIGDFSGQVREHPMACVLPGLDDLPASAERLGAFCARDFSIEERASFSAWAGERFATESSIPKLAALYRPV